MQMSTYRGNNRRSLIAALACFVVAMLIDLASK
jgi:hypothetical protein